MKRLVMILGLTGLLSLVSGPVLGQSSNSRARTLNSQLKEVNKDRNQLRAQLNEKRQEIGEYSREIRMVDDWLDGIVQAIDKNTDTLAREKKEQEVLNARLIEANRKLEERRTLVAQRLRAMYVNEGKSMLSVVVGARDMGDIAERQFVVERIMEADKKLFREVVELQREVLTMKRKQDAAVARIADLKVRQEAEKKRLAEAKQKKRQVLYTLSAQKEKLASELDAMDAESQKIEAQLAALAPRTASGGVSRPNGPIVPFSGRFIRPSSGRISSGFGMRRHPVLGRTRMHNGIDIAAPSGTPIRASASGTVVTATYMRGYGNTVIIDHGQGFSTLYGHCSRLMVRAGQRVGQGQVIAAVGSTGLSTGPHLHFEIRINGRPVNPMGYL